MYIKQHFAPLSVLNWYAIQYLLKVDGGCATI